MDRLGHDVARLGAELGIDLRAVVAVGDVVERAAFVAREFYALDLSSRGHVGDLRADLLVVQGDGLAGGVLVVLHGHVVDALRVLVHRDVVVDVGAHTLIVVHEKMIGRLIDARELAGLRYVRRRHIGGEYAVHHGRAGERYGQRPDDDQGQYHAKDQWFTRGMFHVAHY